VVIGMLLDWARQEPRCMWLLPGDVVADNARNQGPNYVLRPSIAANSKDRWRDYRFETYEKLAERLIFLLEQGL